MSTKPTLKCETETVINVDMYDLENFIQEVTGHKYEIQAGEEWGNDSEHRFTINGKLYKWESEDWAKFKAGQMKRSATNKLRAYLQGLCVDGHIQAGTYIVSLSY